MIARGGAPPRSVESPAAASPLGRGRCHARAAKRNARPGVVRHSPASQLSWAMSSWDPSAGGCGGLTTGIGRPGGADRPGARHRARSRGRQDPRKLGTRNRGGIAAWVWADDHAWLGWGAATLVNECPGIRLGSCLRARWAAAAADHSGTPAQVPCRQWAVRGTRCARHRAA
jgi:hypothetical protein